MRRFSQALGIASLLLAAAGFRLWYIYAYTRPHYAYPEYGQIYALNANGWTVYLTNTERMELYGIAGFAIVCLVGAVALDLMRPRRKPRRDTEWPLT